MFTKNQRSWTVLEKILDSGPIRPRAPTALPVIDWDKNIDAIHRGYEKLGDMSTFENHWSHDKNCGTEMARYASRYKEQDWIDLKCFE